MTSTLWLAWTVSSSVYDKGEKEMNIVVIKKRDYDDGDMIKLNFILMHTVVFFCCLYL